MPSVRLSKDDLKSLLNKLRDGHDAESAGAILGLSEAQVGLAKGKYGAEIAAAFRIGTGKLKGRVMDIGLSQDNASVLLKLLEQRETKSAVDSEVTLVERVIITARCERCGHIPSLQPQKPSPETLRSNREAPGIPP